MPSMNIGISEQDRAKIADGLKVLLADTFTLYLLTHNFHWNVTGMQFRALHRMFEEQYNELWSATDDIAERIRALGHPAPASYSAFAEMTSIQEVHDVPSAQEMVAILNASHEQLVRTCREALSSTEHADDEAALALIADRMVVHEKTAWMLRSMME